MRVSLKGSITDLVILRSNDVIGWCDFILEQLPKDKTLQLTTACIDHEELLHHADAMAVTSVRSAKAVLLLVSPYLYDVMVANPSVNYCSFLEMPDRVVFLILDGSSDL